MTKGMNLESIEKATGRAWPRWLEFFESIDAQNLTHQQLARKTYEYIVGLGIFDNQAANSEGRQNPSGWWSQNITVAYEQHIGRRAPGQREDGTYETSITRTIAGSTDDVMALWLDKIETLDAFNDVAFASVPTASQTDKRRHWAVNLADGTRITADASPKAAGKTLFAVTVMKLRTPEALEAWKAYWKQFLQNL